MVVATVVLKSLKPPWKYFCLNGMKISQKKDNDDRASLFKCATCSFKCFASIAGLDGHLIMVLGTTVLLKLWFLDLDTEKTVTITCFHSFTQISMHVGRAAQSLINISVVRAHTSHVKIMLHWKSRRVALTASQELEFQSSGKSSYVFAVYYNK